MECVLVRVGLVEAVEAVQGFFRNQVKLFGDLVELLLGGRDALGLGLGPLELHLVELVQGGLVLDLHL